MELFTTPFGDHAFGFFFSLEEASWLGVNTVDEDLFAVLRHRLCDGNISSSQCERA